MRGSIRYLFRLPQGCGTGLLSTQVAPYFATYTGYDTSQGMLDVLNTKLDKLPEGTQLRGVKELLVDPASPSLRGRQYHLATSHLTLHHIVRADSLFSCSWVLCTTSRVFIAISFLAD